MKNRHRDILKQFDLIDAKPIERIDDTELRSYFELMAMGFLEMRAGGIIVKSDNWKMIGGPPLRERERTYHDDGFTFD